MESDERRDEVNREMLRLSKKIGRSMMKLPPSKFEEVSWSETQGLSIKNKPDKAWKSNHHVVQVYRNERLILGKLMNKWMIRRNDSEPIREWHEIQNIKNEVIGEEVEAIQIFPKASELVDVANMYWLFTPSLDSK